MDPRRLTDDALAVELERVDREEAAELAADVEAFLACDLRTVALAEDPLAVAHLMAALQLTRADLAPAWRPRLEAVLQEVEELAARLGSASAGIPTACIRWQLRGLR